MWGAPSTEGCAVIDGGRKLRHALGPVVAGAAVRPGRSGPGRGKHHAADLQRRSPFPLRHHDGLGVHRAGGARERFGAGAERGGGVVDAGPATRLRAQPAAVAHELADRLPAVGRGHGPGDVAGHAGVGHRPADAARLGAPHLHRPARRGHRRQPARPVAAAGGAAIGRQQHAEQRGDPAAGDGRVRRLRDRRARDGGADDAGRLLAARCSAGSSAG